MHQAAQEVKRLAEQKRNKTKELRHQRQLAADASLEWMQQEINASGGEVDDLRQEEEETSLRQEESYYEEGSETLIDLLSSEDFEDESNEKHYLNSSNIYGSFSYRGAPPSLSSHAEHEQEEEEIDFQVEQQDEEDSEIPYSSEEEDNDEDDIHWRISNDDSNNNPHQQEDRIEVMTRLAHHHNRQSSPGSSPQSTLTAVTTAEKALEASFRRRQLQGVIPRDRSAEKEEKDHAPSLPQNRASRVLQKAQSVRLASAARRAASLSPLSTTEEVLQRPTRRESSSSGTTVSELLLAQPERVALPAAAVTRALSDPLVLSEMAPRETVTPDRLMFARRKQQVQQVHDSLPGIASSSFGRPGLPASSSEMYRVALATKTQNLKTLYDRYDQVCKLLEERDGQLETIQRALHQQQAYEHQQVSRKLENDQMTQLLQQELQNQQAHKQALETTIQTLLSSLQAAANEKAQWQSKYQALQQEQQQLDEAESFFDGLASTTSDEEHFPHRHHDRHAPHTDVTSEYSGDNGDEDVEEFELRRHHHHDMDRNNLLLRQVLNRPHLPRSIHPDDDVTAQQANHSLALTSTSRSVEAVSSQDDGDESASDHHPVTHERAHNLTHITIVQMEEDKIEDTRVANRTMVVRDKSRPKRGVVLWALFGATMMTILLFGLFVMVTQEEHVYTQYLPQGYIRPRRFFCVDDANHGHVVFHPYHAENSSPRTLPWPQQQSWNMTRIPSVPPTPEIPVQAHPQSTQTSASNLPKDVMLNAIESNSQCPDIPAMAGTSPLKEAIREALVQESRVPIRGLDATASMPDSSLMSKVTSVDCLSDVQVFDGRLNEDESSSESSNYIPDMMISAAMFETFCSDIPTFFLPFTEKREEPTHNKVVGDECISFSTAASCGELPWFEYVMNTFKVPQDPESALSNVIEVSSSSESQCIKSSTNTRLKMPVLLVDAAANSSKPSHETLVQPALEIPSRVPFIAIDDVVDSLDSLPHAKVITTFFATRKTLTPTNLTGIPTIDSLLPPLGEFSTTIPLSGDSLHGAICQNPISGVEVYPARLANYSLSSRPGCVDSTHDARPKGAPTFANVSLTSGVRFPQGREGPTKKSKEIKREGQIEADAKVELLSHFAFVSPRSPQTRGHFFGHKSSISRLPEKLEDVPNLFELLSSISSFDKKFTVLNSNLNNTIIRSIPQTGHNSHTPTPFDKDRQSVRKLMKHLISFLGRNLLVAKGILKQMGRLLRMQLMNLGAVLQKCLSGILIWVRHGVDHKRIEGF